MALKGERVIIETDITRTCTSVAERGLVLVANTSGSGVVLGDRAGSAQVSASPSGKKILGLLLNDVVDIDETRYRRNFHQDQTKVNERCTLLKKGRVTTNKVTGTPTEGAVAYLRSSGVIDPTIGAGGLIDTPPVGKFAGIKDENGYVTVDFNLPIITG